MGKDNFLVQMIFKDAICGISTQAAGEVFQALFEYVETGRVMEMSPEAFGAFLCIKGSVDKATKNYEEVCRRRSEAGKKGGAPKGNTNACKNEPEQSEITDSQEETSNSKENNQSYDETSKNKQNKQMLFETSKNKQNKLNDNDNDSDNDSDNEDEIEKENSPNGESKKDELSLPSKPPEWKGEKVNYNGIMDYFNKTFNGKLPQIRQMTDGRKKAVSCRVAQYGKNTIVEVFQKVLKSPFLLGNNDRNWHCDFDWIFNATNFTKILEGNYDGKSGGKNAARQSAENLADLAVRVLQGSVPAQD